MMKQQHSDSNLRPTRLCQILIFVLVIKIGILGYLSFDALLSGSFGGNNGIAHAEESLGAPAAPELQAKLPDIGIDTPTPGTNGDASIPGAIPGSTTQLTAGENGTEQPKKSGSNRVLPSLGSRKSGIGTANPQSSAPQDDALRQSLLRQQEELARKEESLKQMEKDLTAKLEQMQVLESRLKVMMKDADQAQNTKLRQLVDVISNMKPQQAAQVLESLDPRTSVKVLSNMRGRQAGEILTLVKPQKAASLAEALSRVQLPLE